MKCSDVSFFTGLSPSLIRHKVKKNTFPPPKTKKSQVLIWDRNEVMEWLEEKRQLNLKYIMSKELLELSGLRPRTMYLRMDRGTFPKPVKKIFGRQNLWLRKEVEAWLQERNSILEDTFNITEVIKLTKLTQNQIYQKMNKSKFPKNKKTEYGRVVWSKQEVINWSRQNQCATKP